MVQFMKQHEFASGWKGGLPETPCGSGSRIANTKAQRAWIPQIIRKYGIETVADIGAGDLNWITRMDMPAQYQAYDLVPRRPEVYEYDLLKRIAPKADLIMCLWVLNHFDNDDCIKAIRHIKESGSAFLLMTDRPDWHESQPAEIKMDYVEELKLSAKGDRIILVKL